MYNFTIHSFKFCSNIDTGELCSYFSKHLGSFREVFDAVEVLNSTVSKALHKSAEV